MATKRIYGTETEYGVALGRTVPMREGRFCEEMYHRPGQKAQAGVRYVKWLANGGKHYKDNAHPEYCTPECQGPFEAMVQGRAGDRLTNDIRLEVCWRTGVDQKKVRIFKNNQDSLGQTFGCHENYSITAETDRMSLTKVLAGFLASRVCLCGNGGIAWCDGEWRFVPSCRGLQVQQLTGDKSTVKRSLVNAKDEALADARRWSRLHLICGDSNMGDAANFLKLASCGAVLDAVDKDVEGLWKKLGSWELENPVEAVQKFSADSTGGAKVRTVHGQTIGAVELQELYLEAVSAIVVTDFPGKTLWADMIEDARTLNRNTRSIEWIVCLNALETWKRGKSWEDPETRRLDLMLKDTDVETGLWYKLENRLAGLRLTTDDTVGVAQKAAPDTRARMRSQFVNCLETNGLERDISWDTVDFGFKDVERYPLLDPFQSWDGEFANLLERLGGTPLKGLQAKRFN